MRYHTAIIHHQCHQVSSVRRVSVKWPTSVRHSMVTRRSLDGHSALGGIGGVQLLTNCSIKVNQIKIPWPLRRGLFNQSPSLSRPHLFEMKQNSTPLDGNNFQETIEHKAFILTHSVTPEFPGWNIRTSGEANCNTNHEIFSTSTI